MTLPGMAQAAEMVLSDLEKDSIIDHTIIHKINEEDEKNGKPTLLRSRHHEQCQDDPCPIFPAPSFPAQSP